MTIQDLGSIGELLAAIATITTIFYLAIQVRQNTRALKSATFQNISAEMGRNLEPLAMSGELASIMIKGNRDPAGLTAEERVRYSSMLVATIRRLESVYVQTRFGSIDVDMVRGFETSLVASLRGPFGHDWWKHAKATFYPPFVEHVDRLLASGAIPQTHPSIRLEDDETE